MSLEKKTCSDAASTDLYSAVVGFVDDSFMLFYSHVRRNARRITSLVITLVPLMALLVGSCKTTQTSDFADNIYSGAARPMTLSAAAEQFRATLFPDMAGFHGDHYAPAAGYVSEARGFVEDRPQTMKMLNRDEIGFLFGKPTFHRHDADAEVWQYKTKACVIDFYFYGKKQVSYIDARSKEQTPISPDEESTCLHHIDAQDFDKAERA
jgi:hypothetical protein